MKLGRDRKKDTKKYLQIFFHKFLHQFLLRFKPQQTHIFLVFFDALFRPVMFQASFSRKKNENIESL